MSTPGKKLIVPSVALIALGSWAFLLHSISGPRYGGHPLSYWVTVLGTRSSEDEQIKKATDAIGHIGTNACPYLLNWLTNKPWPGDLEHKLLAAYNRPIHWFNKILRPSADWSIKDSTSERYLGIVKTFRVLGDKAEPAVPELGRILVYGKTSEAKGLAAESLGRLGPLGVPQLMVGITDPDPIVRRHAVFNLVWARKNALPAIPLLIRALQDKDEETARLATMNLGTLRLEPDLVLPELINCISSRNPKIQTQARESLVMFGARARPALNALTSTNLTELTIVREALSRIDRHFPTNAAPSLQ